MGVPNRQIGWSQESNLLWYILSQLKRLSSVIFSLKPKYKVYTAFLSQSGSSAPVATVLENTLGGTPTWARSTTGTYYFLLNDAFPIGQTVIFLNIVGDDSDGRYIAELNYAGGPNANQRGLVIKNATTNVNSDGISSLSSIEIRVYN